MWFLLIPESNGGNVIGERLIGPIGPPSERLNCDFQVLVEDDRVFDVPSVEAPFRNPVRILEFVIQSASDIQG